MHAKIGQVCEDASMAEVLEALMEKLDDLKEKMSLSVKSGEELHSVVCISRLDGIMGNMERRMEKDGYYESAEVDSDLQMLIDELNQFAPAFCSFGKSVSGYGFSIDQECLIEAQYDGTLATGDDVPDDNPDGAECFLYTNDHGNMTLYLWKENKWEELWAVV